MSSLEKYMSEIGPLPLLQESEEYELGIKVQSGDKNAVNRLVLSNLKLVVKIASSYRNCGASLEDLIAEGNIGLVKAAARFNPARSKFSSYSAIWIRKYIITFISEKTREVRVPVNTVQIAFKIIRTAAELRKKLNREVTDEEIGDHLNISRKRVRKLRKLNLNSFSLNSKISTEGANDFCEIIEDQKASRASCSLVDKEDHHLLTEGLEKLTEKEKAIISMRYGLFGYEPHTLSETGKCFQLSSERVRQIQLQIIDKLKHSFCREN